MNVILTELQLERVKTQIWIEPGLVFSMNPDGSFGAVIYRPRGIFSKWRVAKENSPQTHLRSLQAKIQASRSKSYRVKGNPHFKVDSDHVLTMKQSAQDRLRNWLQKATEPISVNSRVDVVEYSDQFILPLLDPDNWTAFTNKAQWTDESQDQVIKSTYESVALQIEMRLTALQHIAGTDASFEVTSMLVRALGKENYLRDALIDYNSVVRSATNEFITKSAEGSAAISSGLPDSRTDYLKKTPESHFIDPIVPMLVVNRIGSEHSWKTSHCARALVDRYFSRQQLIADPHLASELIQMLTSNYAEIVGTVGAPK